MGDILSSPSQPNPSSSISTATSSGASMSSSDLPPHKAEEPKSPIPETLDPTIDSNSIQSQAQNDAVPDEILEQLIEEGDGEGEEEEEGECGFCLFMKAGGCEEAFTDWEKCVEEGEKNKEDIVEKCFQVTSNLKKCMEEHSDYYAPLLQAEKAAEAEVAKQLEEEKMSNNRETGGEESEKEDFVLVEKADEDEADKLLVEEKAKMNSDRETSREESKKEES